MLYAPSPGPTYWTPEVCTFGPTFGHFAAPLPPLTTPVCQGHLKFKDNWHLVGDEAALVVAEGNSLPPPVEGTASAWFTSPPPYVLATYSAATWLGAVGT